MPDAAEIHSLLARLEALTSVGRSLSREKDVTRLLEIILLAARRLVGADGGTLYSLREGALHFEALRNDTLGIAQGGTTGEPVQLPPVPLYRDDGTPNHRNVVSHAALTRRTVNVADAYAAEGYDFSGTRSFDARTGYRSRSFLAVPLENHDHEVIGVLQLINARDPSGQVAPFSLADERLVESFASQAAIVLTNRLLMSQLETLFEALIQLINTALDAKSPYTGRHCQRVPELTMMIADAVNDVDQGPLAGFRMSAQDRYELKIAGMLHDCGKITTPVHIVDKSRKLEAIHDRIHLVDARYEVLFRDLEIALLRGELDAGARDREMARLEEERALLRRINVGGESLEDEDVARVEAIAQRRWTNHDGEVEPLLTADETENLCIRRGTLTPAEREIINDHIVMTMRLLEALPWPRHLARVPEYAGGHHERADGRGYPRGASLDEISIPARILGLADIFEALTASDRPYKHGRPLSEALAILGQMKLEGHVDPGLFDVFVRERVYLRYAKEFLPPEQIDEVDHARIPGALET